jgi:ribosomal protein L37AE/L43A
MPVFLFPSPTQRDACCPLCHRALAVHRVGHGVVRCDQDIVVGRDQQIQTRRARLAHLQRRVLKVRPWAVDSQEEAVRL